MDSISQIEIDLSALEANLEAWSKALGSARICGVVKAGAYGLGSVPIAQRLVKKGVGMLAVYSLAQATELAKAGVQADLLVLMPAEPIARTDLIYRTAVTGRLHMTVHGAEELQRVEEIGLKFGTKMPIHLKIDTGLGRLGMRPEEAEAILEGLPKRRYIRLAGVFSHTAAPIKDPALMEKQRQLFEDFLSRNAERIGKDALRHFAGTYAAQRDPKTHYDMVRLGLGLYGYGAAEAGPGPWAGPFDLKPVLRWTSRIVRLKEVPEGVGVGYNHLFTTKRPTRLAVMPVGYSDGYPLGLSNKAMVRVGEGLVPCPVVGQVNMDQTIIDVTDVEAVSVGDEVELIGRDPEADNGLQKLAELAGSNPYEMLCRLSPHIKRRYVLINSQTGHVGHVVTV
ncbi:MAG: alanine racemase [Phycisphaeraceae bacterium]|nr:alanine racemase [Phycisphaeraceae bacterium]